MFDNVPFPNEGHAPRSQMFAGSKLGETGVNTMFMRQGVSKPRQHCGLKAERHRSVSNQVI